MVPPQYERTITKMLLNTDKCDLSFADMTSVDYV